MGDIGSGTGSSYPTALDTQSSPEVNSPNAGKTKARAEVPNDLAAAIIAIETELGTDPAGTLTDVKTFLQTEHGTNGTHDATKVAMLAGAQTITGAKTFSAAPVLQGTAWPSFSVHKNGTNQTAIVTATPTKVTWSTEEFDTNSDFASDKFTPTVAGKYQLNAYCQWFNAAFDTDAFIYIYKNGVAYKQVRQVFGGTGTEVGGPCISIIADANGTTDYFEVYVQHTSGVDKVIDGTASMTYFMGCRIG